MERKDFVNDKLSLTQKTEGLTFGTDALLLAGFVSGKYKCGLEIGSGSGIISLLLLTREKLQKTVAVEVQPDYADLTKRNAEQNGLSARLRAVCADIRDFSEDAGGYDLIYSNPPYMKAASGKTCDNDAKTVARHEIHGNIDDFCKRSALLLKYGGTFACVYRPERLSELLCSLSGSGIEPKKLIYVHANAEAKPSMILLSAKKGAAAGLTVTPPFFIYKNTDNKEYSKEMEEILETGNFPARFH